MARQFMGLEKILAKLGNSERNSEVKNKDLVKRWKKASFGQGEKIIL